MATAIRNRATRVVASRRATDREWDDAWSSCRYATYFHGRSWATAWEHATSGRILPQPTVVEFDDGRSALLPVSVVCAFGALMQRALCSPAGTYGGHLGSDDLDAEHARAVAEWLTDGFASIEWRANPFARLGDETAGPGWRADSTQVVELGVRFDEVVGSWSRSHREAVRRAGRRGVTVRVADSAADWSAYDGVYRSSLERWGDSASSCHPVELFDALRADSSGVRLWVAERDRQIVAGAVCCYAHNHVSYWHGAALAEHFDAKPMQLVLHDAMEHAHSIGVRWFDFNPSGGHAGTRTFKQRFGARELEAPVFDRRVGIRGAVARVASLMGLRP